jgi:hypothetical protein
VLDSSVEATLVSYFSINSPLVFLRLIIILSHPFPQARSRGKSSRAEDMPENREAAERAYIIRNQQSAGFPKSHIDSQFSRLVPSIQLDGVCLKLLGRSQLGATSWAELRNN